MAGSNNYKYCVLGNRSLHNAGDFLIYDSIMNLLDSWEDTYTIESARELSNADLSIINKSQALILTGSNLYRKNELPILNEELIDEIKVPIIPIGMGAQAPSDHDFYEIDKQPLRVIKKIHKKCKVSSVRDIHTYFTLKRNGIHNIILTGCPVLFHSLSLPSIKENKTGDKLFIPQFYAGHRYTMFSRHPRNKFEKAIRKVIKIAEVRANDYLVKKIMADNKSFFILTQQKRDREIVVDWQLKNRLINWETASDYIEIIKKASYIYTFRLHGGMLALSYGVPAAFFGIDSRVQSFCQMLGIDFHRFKDRSGVRKTEYGPKFVNNRLLLAKKMVTFFELNNININNEFKNEITKHNI